MATSNTFVVSLLLISFFIFHLVEAQTVVNEDIAAGHPNPKINCGEACKVRCRLSSRPHLCNRACGTCCSRCLCVPPGTAGNHEKCPCYASLTTRGGRKKCP